MEKEDFRITQGKEFQITFENGWTVSVHFGFGNYCENRDILITEERVKAEEGCPNAEVWAWNEKKKYPKDPEGWKTPKEVLNFMNEVARKN